ncbi:G-type lectin S-receptor-like serine/threonine-protein kinase [Raphanus sativus]|nr:G-type lectin S-receptor-like serine/threonine-protein kinase [Raphanus sativus]
MLQSHCALLLAEALSRRRQDHVVNSYLRLGDASQQKWCIQFGLLTKTLPSTTLPVLFQSLKTGILWLRMVYTTFCGRRTSQSGAKPDFPLSGCKRRLVNVASPLVTVPVAPNATWVQLMDNGNLRLQDNRNNGEILWESFKHPYKYSFLQRMTLGTSNTTGENLKLTSWRSYVDPSTGNYTAGLASFSFPELTFPELLIWKNSVPIWRSGQWNGQVFIGLPDVDSLLFLDGFNLINDNQGTFSMSFANDSFIGWRIGVRFPSTDCDAFGRCGPYGICNSREDPACKCVKGFVPRNNTEWNARNWSNGCVRKALLRCERQRDVSSNGGGGGKGDGFLKLQKMKVPINAEQSLANVQACPKQCSDNCSCTAYAYDRGIGCMLWSGDLVDMQSFLGSGIDLYIRVAHSELKTHSNRVLMITAPLLGVVFVAAVCGLFACRKFKKRPAPEKDTSAELMYKRMEELTSGNESASNQVKLKDLPLFEFKGVLPEGHEIAVKRLSRASGQGLEELLNEVVVISKLQHRNLVKLLGCCLEGEESGYMSPEYAMEGFFSEKSDVFSLGVIFLEIISGTRNSHKEENDLNLLAYAWKLWNDGEAASLANPIVFDECFEKEIRKCVQIGLLCVQEVANDRPNVSTVIWMLTTENTNLPEPKQPAFIARSGFSIAESSDLSSQKVSINDVSLTAVTGR